MRSQASLFAIATRSMRALVLMVAVFSASQSWAADATVRDGGTLQLAGVTYRLDGIDLLSTLSGHSPLIERQIFWRIKRPHEQRAVRSGRWKLLQDGANFYLFDVSADPGERHDLTAEHPELVGKLSAALDAWEKDVDGSRVTIRDHQ